MARLLLTKIDLSDWDEILDGHYRAFAEEAFCGLRRGPDTPQNRQIFKQQLVDGYLTQSNSVWLKVIDVNNERKILGVANYKVKPTYVPLEKTEPDAEMVWLEDAEDKRILAAMITDIVARRLRNVKEGHIFLETLFVLPEFQGRGIASQLLKWGRDLADHLMVPIWLESSIEAHNLYLHHGFDDVEPSRMVMGKWDIEYSLMRREPNSNTLALDELAD
ncbi:hypothetical protein FQN50_000127 [Emmonsiellopsis sp. PD_5]|nr:hypothetical protein FQN50_000127 [Emmonsiellopsis sp. PD_5]